MLKRIFAIVFLLLAALLFTLLFIPFIMLWIITGKDYIKAYIEKSFDIFNHLTKP
ncbi:MAG: hypothetical protein ABI921_00545 [Panacibacter sp.]